MTSLSPDSCICAHTQTHSHTCAHTHSTLSILPLRLKPTCLQLHQPENCVCVCVCVVCCVVCIAAQRREEMGKKDESMSVYVCICASKCGCKYCVWLWNKNYTYEKINVCVLVCVCAWFVNNTASNRQTELTAAHYCRSGQVVRRRKHIINLQCALVTFIGCHSLGCHHLGL